MMWVRWGKVSFGCRPRSNVPWSRNYSVLHPVIHHQQCWISTKIDSSTFLRKCKPSSFLPLPQVALFCYLCNKKLMTVWETKSAVTWEGLPLPVWRNYRVERKHRTTDGTAMFDVVIKHLVCFKQAIFAPVSEPEPALVATSNSITT